MPNTSYLVRKITNCSAFTEIDNKVVNVTSLVTNGTLNAKVAEIENKTPGSTGLATKKNFNPTFTEIEKKISHVTEFMKKTDFFIKLIKISIRVTSHKIKQIKVDKKLRGQNFLHKK